MLMMWLKKPEWACASTPSCKPVSSPSAVFCQKMKRSKRSRNISRKPTANAVKRLFKQNFARLIPPWRTFIQVKVPEKATSTTKRLPPVPENAPEFVKDVFGTIIGKERRQLCLSANCQTTAPTQPAPPSGKNAISRLKFRSGNLIFASSAENARLSARMRSFAPRFMTQNCLKTRRKHSNQLTRNSKNSRAQNSPFRFHLKTAPAAACVWKTARQKIRPIPERKAINMSPQPPLREKESENWEFFFNLPDPDRTKFEPTTVKNSQLLRPLFEFSGACAGCGETPYIRLLTQLFGDRTVIANATGCSSIYGGNLPTTPYTFNDEGRGPAWSNSLFEDNAEFGLGYAPDS